MIELESILNIEMTLIIKFTLLFITMKKNRLIHSLEIKMNGKGGMNGGMVGMISTGSLFSV
jgi:hypothetical protein